MIRSFFAYLPEGIDAGTLARAESELTELAGQYRPDQPAKLAQRAPGMCNPDNDTPCLSGAPSQAQIDNDRRSAGQRNHDALAAMGTNLLASGDLGRHHGLPATIVVSVSLAELESAAGKAMAAGGTWLPMRDVIRLASGAHHYLRIYDGAKEIALYHGKRLANAGQRLALYAKEGGCTHPGCPVSALLTEVHHKKTTTCLSRVRSRIPTAASRMPS